MKVDTFKRFTVEEANEWGKKHFKTWLPRLQNQEYSPQTAVEEFFRYYTQGTGKVFNSVLRNGIANYDFSDSFFTKSMFNDSIAEINKHKLSEDIVVYRYVSKYCLEKMLECETSRSISKDSVLCEQGYLSTTLSLEAVRDQPYAYKGNSCLTIYVPKGTPCVYVDLVSDMHEQEMLFAPGIRLKIIRSSLFRKSIECIVI